MPSKKKHDLKFFIFSLIGIFNTLFDLTLYVTLYNLTNSIIIANLVSTSAALVGSYFLNSRITFKSKSWTTKKFLSFIAVTLTGLWVVQTSMIYLVTPLLQYIPESFWQQFGTLEHDIKDIIPKVVATAITFIWNFLWYKKVIFKEDDDRVEESIRAAEL